jgi:alpha-tubulin suppressor-like RCC1 family protein
MQKKLLLFANFLFLLNSIYAATSVAPKRGSARSNYPRNSHHVVGGGGYAVEMRNGEIWAWGDNTYGQLGIGNNIQQESPMREITNAINWADINPGQSHVLAVKADGTLWAWGRNNFGQLGIGNTIDQNIPQQIGTDNDWVTTGCGGNQSFAIKSNGTLWAWGNNSSGQLGIGNNINSNSPVQIGNANNWTDVAAGNNFTVALNSSGQILTWGSDASGQLGNGPGGGSLNSPSNIVLSNDKWLAIEAGANYAMAIKHDGTLFSWGANNQGQLGLGNYTNQHTPQSVSSTLPWIGISCGQEGNNSLNQHSLGLKADGTVWSWGDNNLGQLGNTQVSINTNEPQIISSIADIVAVECGWGVSYIRNVSGQVYACGTDTSGAIGNATVGGNSGSFIAISVVPIGWSSFSAGENYNVAIKSDGTLWFWGSNTNGQLGNGTAIPSQVNTATQIGTSNNWKLVSAGTHHILAINSAGQLFAWGSNSSGQIGNGTSGGFVGTPVQIASTTPWTSVSAGNLFSLGVKANGTLWAWGINGAGQIGQGNLNTFITPTQVGSDNKWVFVNAGFASAAAVKADGTLWMWGENNFGQLGKGNNSSGSQNYSPVQVSGGDWLCIGHASGSTHVVALKSNGTLWSWGNNGSGALGNGTNTTITANYSPSQIGNEQTWVLCAAGQSHSAALKVDGSPWTWGDNSFGQLGLGYFGNSPSVFVPTQVFTARFQDPLDIVIDISCGWQHTAVIKDYRERICVTGRNLNGQIGDGTFGTPNNRNEFQCLVYAPPCVAPTIPSLFKSPSNNVCPGTNSTLSITSGNLNSSTEWRWYADACGSNFINAGNSITVNPTSTRTYFVRGESGGCAPGSCASITVNVTATFTPSVSISTANTTVCAGTNVVFTATPTNGGFTPSYQWKVNGNNVGTNNATYSTSSLTNGQVVSCVLTSSLTCAVPTTATSNSLNMTVTASVTPSISISTATTTVCSGASVLCLQQRQQMVELHLVINGK